MNYRVSIGLLVAVFLTSAPARAAKPNSYEPTGPWVVDFADQRCVAGRSYGAGGKILDLTLQPSPVGDAMQITLYSRGMGPGPAEGQLVRLSIDDQASLDVRMASFRTAKTGLRALRINLTPENFAPMRTAKSVSLRTGPREDRFTLRQMPQIMSKLDECLKDLQAHWNIGAEHKLKMRAETTRPFAAYFSSDDFPAHALYRGEEGRSVFVLMIDEEGKIAGCSAAFTSEHASLDEQPCIVLREKARFKPAIGLDGKPAKDVVVSSVTWKVR